VWLAVPAAWLLISVAKGFMAVHRSRITLKEDYIEIHNGRFADIRNYVKYSNVEVVSLRSTPFTPYSSRVSLTLSTNGTSFTLRSLRVEEAREIYELLLCNCAGRPS
jgi:membrane protein YdbS with pleckstrin-like domain